MEEAATGAACCAACVACQVCSCCVRTQLSCCSKTARFSGSKVAYFVMLLLSVISAWIMRDNAHKLNSDLYSLSDCDGNPDSEACRAMGRTMLLRMTMGGSLFFLIMALSTIGLKHKGTWQYNWNFGSWGFKIPLFIVFHIFPVFIPAANVDDFGYFAACGAAVFLLIQVVLVIDMAYRVNEWTVERDSKAWLAVNVLISLVMTAIGITLIVLSHRWFTLDGKCRLNSFFIYFSMTLSILNCIIAMTPKVEHGAVLPSAAVALYSQWLVFVALYGQNTCNTSPSSNSEASPPQFVDVISVLITITVSCFTAVRTSTQDIMTGDRAESWRASEASPGQTSSNMQSTAGVSGPTQPAALYTMPAAGDAANISVSVEGGMDGQIQNALNGDSSGVTSPYAIAWFHVCFALASMFIGMQLSNWNQNVGDIVKSSSPATWVSVIASWATAALYAWSLAGPVLFKDRQFFD